MIPAEWIKPWETTATADQVKKMKLGTKVTIVGADRFGECTRIECALVQSGKKKVLVYRDYAGNRVTKQIKDRDNKRFVVQKEVIA